MTSRTSLGQLRLDVGQLLILGFDQAEADAVLLRRLHTLQPGGVILFARNIISAPQTHELLAQCRAAAGSPLFTCVDLEGGAVDRLRNVVAPAPSALEVASTRNRKLFRRHGELLGAEARALGFNVDFAPVSDLGFQVSRAVMGSRTVSADPVQVSTYVREFLRGLRSAKVLGCGKHFPGLGEANLDTHRELPEIKKPWKRLWEEDLLPYRRLHEQFPFVMVAHAAYPAVTKDRTPASLSRKWMRDLLRKKIGYKGIILSDDLEMGGALAAGSIGEVAVGTMRAGADMYLVCHKEEFVQSAYEAILREAERDRKFTAQVAQAAQRVLRFKRRAPELKRVAPKPSQQTIEKLRKQVEQFKRALEKAGSKK